MADLTLAVAQNHAEAPHQTGHSTKLNAVKRKRRRVQPIARKFVQVLKYSPDQPRGKGGKWVTAGGEPAVVVDGDPIGLAAEARKAGSFENFRKDFLLNIKHGLYWHLTDNPNFAIDAAKGPRDMSSMAGGGMEPGALMVTSHLENWDAYYNVDPETDEPNVKRPHAVLIDMSSVPREEYRQISRGFGNEFYLADSSKAKVLGVVPIKMALALDTKHQEALPQSDEELRAFYDRAVASKKYDPNQPRDEQGQWSKTTGRTFTSDEGYEWHEKGPVAEWARQLPYADVQAINDYAGFGYHDTNDLRRGTYKVPIKDHFVRAATPEEMRRVGWDVEKNEWVPSVKVKEGEFKTGYPIDPRDKITPESIARFGHPMGKRTPRDFDPDDPYHRVDEGRIVINQYYRPVAGGPTMMFSIQKAGPDLERLQQVQQDADALDDLIANRGYELPEAIVVERGAYLPGISFEDLQNMQYEGPNGEPPSIWEEKGFTSTMVGDAGGRAKSYPALGKWESITHRFGTSSGVLVKHQDEVGSAVRFHITLPAGTKVAPVEGTRRLRHEFPKKPIDQPVPEGTDPQYWVESDRSKTPTTDTKDLDAGKEGRRTESELLLGSGARFRVTKVHHGQTYQTGDPTLKPVPIVEVYLEYIGGGSSQGRKS